MKQNTILVEHKHAHLFIYHPQRFCSITAETSSCDRDQIATMPKILTLVAFYRKSLPTHLSLSWAQLIFFEGINDLCTPFIHACTCSPCQHCFEHLLKHVSGCVLPWKAGPFCTQFPLLLHLPKAFRHAQSLLKSQIWCLIPIFSALSPAQTRKSIYSFKKGQKRLIRIWPLNLSPGKSPRDKPKRSSLLPAPSPPLSLALWEWPRWW